MLVLQIPAVWTQDEHFLLFSKRQITLESKVDSSYSPQIKMNPDQLFS